MLPPNAPPNLEVWTNEHSCRGPGFPSLQPNFFAIPDVVDFFSPFLPLALDIVSRLLADLDIVSSPSSPTLTQLIFIYCASSVGSEII